MLRTAIILCLGPAVFACDHPAEAGSQMSMNYVGTIDASSVTGEKGKQFDSSYDRQQAFDFVLGQGQVIKGWDEGLIGVCPGDSKTLVLPPDMGYGDEGAGADIPGGATLNFKVEVISIDGMKAGGGGEQMLRGGAEEGGAIA